MVTIIHILTLRSPTPGHDQRSRESRQGLHDIELGTLSEGPKMVLRSENPQHYLALGSDYCGCEIANLGVGVCITAIVCLHCFRPLVLSNKVMHSLNGNGLLEWFSQRCGRREPYVYHFVLPDMDEFAVCTICHEYGFVHLVMLACGHQFHQNCIDRWYQQQQQQGHALSCPNCRAFHRGYRDGGLDEYEPEVARILDEIQNMYEPDEKLPEEEKIIEVNPKATPVSRFRDMVRCHLQAASDDKALDLLRARMRGFMQASKLGERQDGYKIAVDIIREEVDAYQPIISWHSYKHYRFKMYDISTWRWWGDLHIVWRTRLKFLWNCLKFGGLTLLKAYLLVKFGIVVSTSVVVAAALFPSLAVMLYHQICSWRTTELVVERVDVVRDHCYGMTIPPPVSGELIVPEILCECAHKTVRVGITIGMDYLVLPRTCVHNQIQALANRQMTLPIGDPEQRLRMYRFGNRVIAGLLDWSYCEEKWEDLHFEDFVSRYPAGRARMLRNIYNDPYADQFPKVGLTTFVKREWGKEGDPRNISNPAPPYLVSTFQYWVWMKQVIQNNWATFEMCLTRKIIYTSGMDGVFLGRLFTHFERLGWYATLGDFKRHDGHQEVECIEAEMEFYDDYLPADLVTQLRKQTFSEGRNRSGLFFKFSGKRISGVINTSFGNTKVTAKVVASYCVARFGPDGWTLMANGDDFVLFTAEPFNVAELQYFALQFGHELVVSLYNPDEYDLLEYCNMRPWDTGDVRVLGPKVTRALMKSLMPSSPVPDLQAHCIAVAKGFQYCFWVPMVGPFMKRLAMLTPNKEVLLPNAEYHINVNTHVPINRHSINAMCHRVYGFDADTLDHHLDSINVAVMGQSIDSSLIRHCLEIDGAVRNVSVQHVFKL